MIDPDKQTRIWQTLGYVRYCSLKTKCKSLYISYGNNTILYALLCGSCYLFIRFWDRGRWTYKVRSMNITSWNFVALSNKVKLCLCWLHNQYSQTCRILEGLGYVTSLNVKHQRLSIISVGNNGNVTYFTWKRWGTAITLQRRRKVGGDNVSFSVALCMLRRKLLSQSSKFQGPCFEFQLLANDKCKI